MRVVDIYLRAQVAGLVVHTCTRAAGLNDEVITQSMALTTETQAIPILPTESLLRPLRFSWETGPQSPMTWTESLPTRLGPSTLTVSNQESAEAKSQMMLPMEMESGNVRRGRSLQVTTPSLSPNQSPTSSALTRGPYSSNRPSTFPSFVPSAIPSDAPSKGPISSRPSPQPAFKPTSAPTRPTLPTAPNPYSGTFTPSTQPSIALNTATRNVIQMVLQNMPDMTNETSIGLWEAVTSNHIVVYWDSRPFPPISVVDVTTVLLRQENVVDPDTQQLRHLDTGTTTNSQLSIYYQQEITYDNLFESDIIKDNEDSIFLDPFERSEAAYVDALVSTFALSPETSYEIRVTRTVVLEASSSPPTTMSPTDAPVSFVSNSDGGLSLAAIALITTALCVVLTAGLTGYLYLRKRQHEHDMAWAADNARPVMEQSEDDFATEMEDYPTVIQSGRSSPREMPVVDEGDEESKDDDESLNEYSTGPTETYTNDLPCDDDEDDPTFPYTPDSTLGRTARERSISVDDVDDVDDDLSNVIHVDTEDPVSPLEAISSTSGGSVHEPPSLWAFQVKVIDLED